MSTRNGAEQRRVIGRPWKRGQSGNPGGRPKEVKHVQAVARTYTVDAIETLVEIMRNRDEPARARAAAAEAVLDRGWGRAPQALQVNGGEPQYPDLLPHYTDAELLERFMAKVYPGPVKEREDRGRKAS